MRGKAKTKNMTARAVARRIIAGFVGVGALIVLVVGVRLALPFLIKSQVNKKLSELNGYAGDVEEVDLHLLRGRVDLVGVAVVISAAKTPLPLFRTNSIDLKWFWRPLLLHRKLVADVRIESPRLNYIQGTIPPSPPTDYAALLREAMPFDVDAFRVNDGEIRYRDYSSSPTVDVALSSINAVAINLTNKPAPGLELPADVQIKAKAVGDAEFALDLKADPLNETPTFELKQSVNGVDLTKFNDFFNAYTRLNVKKGTFGMYAEAAGKDGKFVGFAEPHFQDFVLDKKYKNPLKDVWAAVASSVKWLFSNKRTKQVATRIPIKGDFEKTQVGYFPAAIGILKNAYVQALTPPEKLKHVTPEDAAKAKVKK
jgi:hypothetical protein